ncbi:hypothetical protein CK203_112432 [Vitis vinifera]|uniref:Uncharacterized protein n=1 Tax=Vitis vinifera TaxID=29760 RepID=A0A438FD97_VITVI|nr:hypothetical protein CK203_112432 [Vitis vinifera]
MYTLNEEVDMKAKFAAMTSRMEELELKMMHEVQAFAETPVQVNPCSIFQSYEHLVEECPTIPVAREMFGEQANVIGQVKPNSNCFVWQYLQLKLEESSKFFMEAKSTSVQQLAQPSQPSQQGSSLEQAIVNLSKCKRRVDFLLNLTKTPRVSTNWKLMRENLHSFAWEKGDKNASEILEVLRQVKGLNVNKKAFLTEQVSAIIQCKSPLKYKDHECPTISVMIGGKVVEKALLDLGASVKLLPYSVYKQLGLGELKPTSITLSLADRNGLMQLTFGNMTLELNIFHMFKEANYSGRRRRSKRGWRRKEEILPLFNKKEEQDDVTEEFPKLNLKPLPMEL